MKNLHRTSIIYTLLAVLTLGSCSKNFLAIDPETTANSDNFYKNQEEVEQAVNGAYNILQDLGRLHLWLYGEMRSDNTTFQYNNQDRGLETREFIDQFLVDASAEPIRQFWQLSYQGITRTNDVLARLDEVEMTDEKRAQYRGEVLFLRAFHYFNLVRQYGGVPLRLAPVESPDSALSKGRAPVEEVYNQIVSDLSSAADNLSNATISSAEKGRVTEGAARTLLAKVYLTLKKYDEAIDQLRKVSTMGYSLVTNYADNFSPEKKNGAESIFEIQYLGSQPSLSSNFMYQFAPYTSGSVVTQDPNTNLGGSAGWNIPTQDMIDAYEEGDKRKASSLAEGFTNSSGTFVAVPYVKKYNFGFVEPGQTDVNFPVLRYADVLLMLAECLNEKGFAANGEAFNLVNNIRERAGLKPLEARDINGQDRFREAVFQERRVELAFENHRWYDLLRTGKAVEIMNAHGAREKDGSLTIPTNAYQVTNNRLLLPIPQREINLDNLEQNPQ
ncbi:RagB/SusD family nutrient uptake outer membrane protein [Olivibacter ginsenosidimutans]|uniref:RagB/SusD family nutrient uptake outer membrane protein n=1 Tax=Olivibacter ginsenosidimutans TaxID=1176537 RepID=A0ABP9BUK3_9SPHI